MGFLFVLIVGLLAGTISGIVGTGSSIMLMPVLVYQYGPKEAVPIMAVAAVMANLSRILAWWREVDWRACLAYSVTGIPAAALGARTLLALPSHAVDIAIGLFLIAMVPVRHWLARHQLKAQLWHLAVGGAIIGYLTGIVVSTGPLSVPLFLFYGLTKGAFLATEAASSLGLYLSKSVTFERFGALTPDIALKGLIAGSSLMFGAFIAKRFVLHLEPDVFRLLMDGIMLAAGISLAVDGIFIGIRRSSAPPEPFAMNSRPSDACHIHSASDHRSMPASDSYHLHLERLKCPGESSAPSSPSLSSPSSPQEAGTPSIRPSAA